MKSTRVLIRAKGRGLCIERGLYDCLQKELFADVTLNCIGGKIRANKGVLAAASPVFCHFLRDLPLTDDACVIMAGYTEEEVQGLVRYIYTGQLSAPQIQGSSWEKIMEDFKVGSLVQDDDLASIHELTDYGDSPLAESESNGISHQSMPTVAINRVPARALGPKIVAVTSPRPLIVQVQSLTGALPRAQSFNHQYENDYDDIPNEMTVDEANHELMYEAPSYSQMMVKRKRTGGKPAKRLQKSMIGDGQIAPSVAVAAAAAAVSIKKLSVKRAKPTSKFARKKYVCPHCNRRFLTRGNIKNHLRIHSKDKPFQCPLCQDLFAYQGVYQRHLMKHRENNEIDDHDLGPYIADSVRLAEEIGRQDSSAVRMLENDEDDDYDFPPGGLKSEENELEVRPDNGLDYEEQEQQTREPSDEDKNGDLIVEEEEKIASQLQSNANLTVSSKSDEVAGLHFLPGVESSSTKVQSSTKEVSTPGGEDAANENPLQLKILCDFCPMTFNRWSLFYVHRCAHTGETPIFKCSVCTIEFSSIEALKNHKLSEHSGEVVVQEPVLSTKLNFQCRHCPEKSRTLKERGVHERTHLAETLNASNDSTQQ